MKIGIVCPYDITKGGGVQEIVKAHQAGLAKLGHEVYIITPRPAGYDEEPGDHILFVGGAADVRSPGSTTVQVSAGLNDDIQNMLDEHDFDILHFHEPWVPMLSLQILSRSKALNVATFHAKLPEGAMMRTMAKAITPYSRSVLKYIDVLTAVSDAAADWLCSLTDEPVAIIPNGIELSRFRPPLKFNDKRKAKTIFYVGRLEGRKGVNYLLKAFRVLSDRHPDAELVIGGDGVDRAKLEMLADDLELKNVTFLGYVKEKDKEHYFRTADLFCAPSIFGESFGVVLLEAMASGLVTVAGDNPGYTAVLNGVGALSLINPKHTNEFARRLELMLYESDLRTLWRKWALEDVKQYDYSHIVEQYEKLYIQSLAKARRSHA